MNKIEVHLNPTKHKIKENITVNLFVLVVTSYNLSGLAVRSFYVESTV